MVFLKRTTRGGSSFLFRYARELGLALLAVAAVVITVVAMSPRGVAEDRPASAPASTQAEAQTVPNVDIIGDSYVAGSEQGGYGAANWTKIVGSRFYTESRPLDMNVIGNPGAGYIVRGGDKFTFAEAATARLRSTADLVLVFGSRNDGRQDPDAMTAAATKLYQDIRHRAPHAKLVVVGPAWVDKQVPSFIAADSKAIAGAAAGAGAEFVDPLREGWFFGADAKLIGGDGVHPTDAGHRYLAEKMYAIIDKALAAT